MAHIVTVPGNKPFKITKWKAKKGQRVTASTILALYKLSGSDNVLKLKFNSVGTVLERLIEEGQEGKSGCPVLKVEGCLHPTVMKDMCADCGADLRLLQETKAVVNTNASTRKPSSSMASVAMVHSIPELIVSEEQALEIGRQDEQRLLQSRKLVLLVDLDQTLLHTTNDNIPANLKDVEHFQLWHGRWMWYHTKFRPGTREFLANISQMYELHICTFGVRMYAHTIAGILDPKKEYFSHRILSRDECFSANSKTANLRALFPCGDSMVGIIDDRDDVWRFAPNLIHVKPYHFFCGTADINAPPGLTKNAEDDRVMRHNVKITRVPRKTTHNQSENVKYGVPNAERGPPPDQNLKEGTTSETSQSQSMTEETSQSQSITEGTSQSQSNNETTKSQSSVNGTCQSQSVANETNQHVTDVKTGHSQSKASESNTSESNTSESNTTETESGQSQSTDGNARISGTHTKCFPVDASGDKISVEEEDLPSTDNDKPVEAMTELGDTAKPAEKDITATSGTEVTQESNMDAQEGSSNVASLEKTNSTSLAATNNGDLDMSVSSESESGINETGPEKSSEDRKVPDNGAKSMSIAVTPSNTVVTGGEEESEKSEQNSIVKESSTADVTSREVSPERSDREEGEVTSEEDGQKVRIEEYDEVIEWEDTDDYLIYLEDILKRVHLVYYEMYEQKLEKKQKEIPDLKKVIPYVRKKVLKGANILFSGVIPTNQSPVKSRAYNVAKSLGATVQTAFVPKDENNKYTATTHLVAAKPGTVKVVQAKKHQTVKIVNPDWLWACNDRWEWVDERLFQLGDDAAFPFADSPDPWKPKKKKKMQDKKEKAATVQPGETDGEFKNYNPLYAFSSSDIKTMDAEVDDIMEESESDGDDSEGELRRVVLGYGKKRQRESSSEESMSAEYPKGWGNKGKRSKMASKATSCDNSEKGSEDDGMDDDENEVERRIVENPNSVIKFSDNSSDNSEFNDSIGSVDDEMAAALEKEFLSY